jgi:pimeloyl-ACP methyl ester carboxylesterase
MSHLQFDWESPVWQHWIDGLSERNTLIRYDERGNGLSDWDVADLSFETMIADLESVVDAAGLERFTLLGVSQSCAVSVAYAVRRPERVLGLVLYGGYGKGWRKRGSDHEIATREALATLVRQGWNQNNSMFRQFFSSLYVPNARPDQIAWFDELQRRTMSPENAWRLQNVFGDIDVSFLLSEVAVSTLVLHARRDAMVPFESGRALATGIPGARFVELDSANHILVQDEPAFLRFLTEVRAFVSANEASRDSTLTADQTRKRITVLAAEIISPLLAFEEADPEVAMNAIDPLLDLAVEVVGHHGGTVVSRGQADLTAIFGAPIPAEDHAHQACRAALAMKHAVEQVADGASRIRASLDTGEAIVRVRAVAHGSRAEVNGAPVRLVRQLTQSLRRNVVAATDGTREAAGGFFRMEPLARSEHPSFARDLRTHAVLGENKAFSRWQLRAERGLTRLIARDAELQLLSQACQRARRGHGQVIGIVADPGMGKAGLAHEILTSDAIGGYTVLEAGAFESEATASFRVIGRLLRAFFAIDEQDTTATAAGRVSRRLGTLDAEARMGSPLMFALGVPIQDAEWASLAVADRARRVRDAVAVLLTLEARRRPVVVLAEDLHRIDPESEDILNRVVEAIRHQRILLIATYRTEYRPSWAQTSVFSQLRLEPLGPAETDSLLYALLGDDPSVAGLIPLIAARADGMPLFMEEAVRALAQRSALAGKPGHYIAQEDIRDVEIPSNVLSVIAARVISSRRASGGSCRLRPSSAVRSPSTYWGE